MAQLLRELDEDGDGKVSEREFRKGLVPELMRLGLSDTDARDGAQAVLFSAGEMFADHHDKDGKLSFGASTASSPARHMYRRQCRSIPGPTLRLLFTEHGYRVCYSMKSRTREGCFRLAFDWFHCCHSYVVVSVHVDGG